MKEEQQGFRHNRSSTDTIFILRQLIEKSIEYDKPLFLCFVDSTKAFDRVKLKDTLTILEREEINADIIKIIHELNTNNRKNQSVTHDDKRNIYKHGH